MAAAPKGKGKMPFPPKGKAKGGKKPPFPPKGK